MLHLVKVALNLPCGRLDLHEFAHHHVKEDRDRGFPEFYKIKGKQLNVRHHHVKEDRNHGFLEFYKIKGKQLNIREIFLIPQGMMVLLLRSSS